MSREVIHIHGQDIVVREDTAKAFQGLSWAMISIFALAVITALLFIVLLLNAAKDGTLESPSQMKNSSTK